MVDAGGRGEAPATLPAPAGDHRDDGGTCWLTIAEGDEAQVVPLPNEGTLRIGRSDGCEIVLRNPLASRVHGEIKVGNGRITIRDLGSANGTRVGPLRIGPLVEHRLEPGTAAFIGTACLVAHELPGRERDASLVADSAAAIVWLRAWDARAIALARIRFAKRLSEPWVLRLVAQTLREGEVLIRSGAHEAWLVLACDGDRAARAAAEAATRRIHPWALAAGGEVHVVARQAGDDWERAVRRILEGCSPGANTQAGVVVGQESMRAVFNLVDRVAAGVISVLVLGETGVGKDVVATAIHSRSARRSGPFLRLNCAALSETLLESELCGFEAGAFTGARHAKPGLLEIAHGGTVFLDEAG